jgi:hypothetical protein
MTRADSALGATGWDRAPAIDGYAFLAPHVGALCIGVRAARAGTAGAAGAAGATGGGNTGGTDVRADVHDIWQIPLGRPGPVLSSAVFRAAVQLLAYLEPVALVKVPESELSWYLDTPLTGREREALMTCRWAPEQLRAWARGMRR